MNTQNKSDIIHRLGRFSIPRDIIYQEPENLAVVFSGMIIVEATMRWVNNGIEYVAMDSRFDINPIGFEPKRYDIILSRGDDGKINGCNIMVQDNE